MENRYAILNDSLIFNLKPSSNFQFSIFNFQLKKALAVLICLAVLFLVPFSVSASEVSEKTAGGPLPVPEIYSPSAIILDARTGAIIYEKNAYEKRPMASTTKLMTTLIALESGDIGREVTVAEEATYYERGTTELKLKPGERITMYDLAAAMMMLSANDAAQVVAVEMAGSFTGFASIMNEKASELGMKNTHFVTPSGLNDPNHFSTAYDMALLGIECSKNPELVALASTHKKTIFFGEKTLRPYELSTHNELLPGRKYSKKDDPWICDGLKTGYVAAAGYCLVSHVVKDDISLVCVTLGAGSPTQYFKDHRALHEYAFSHYVNKGVTPTIGQAAIPVMGGTAENVPVYVDGSGAIGIFDKQEGEIEKRVELSPYVDAPVSKGQVVGHVRYYYGNSMLIDFPIRANENIDCADQNWVSAYADLINRMRVG